MTGETKQFSVDVSAELAGMRLDQALTRLFPTFSRARLQQWVKAGQVRVDDAIWRSKDKLAGGEHIALNVEILPEERWQPQEIALDIVFEDSELIVINKPPGLVVHPAAGNRDGTLLNALLHFDPQIAAIPRAGIVHRLDKETSGLMVVARTLPAHKHLVDQLQARSVTREYDAVIAGVLVAGGRVDAPIGRHRIDRKRMAVVANGKPAVTHYRVAERFNHFTRVRVNLETGRTHQIRVHMAHIRHPLVGDPVYGGRLRLPKGASAALEQALRAFRRQALHAHRLALVHPISGEPCEWQVDAPADMQQLIATLRDEDGA